MTTPSKVYSTKSVRRAMTDVRNAQSGGQMDVVPSYASIARYLRKPELTPLLSSLIQQSAIPLSSVEYHFSPDSSGFGTSVYDRWFDEKWGRMRKGGKKWITGHIIAGSVTNTVAAAHVTETRAHDTNFFEFLVNAAAENFDILEVSADKAYLSRKNQRIVRAIGAEPYIPFKENSTEGKPGTLWHRLYRYCQYHEDEFNAHYHKRSNVETAFHMIKAKFGGAVRSKSTTGQVNEVLSKILCHNICVLIQSMHTLEVDPVFEELVAA